VLELDRIYCIDSLQGLKQLDDSSVDCVVTSPPYWGLRDYGIDGQFGLEKTPEEYVSKLVGVFREVKRVLKKEGTVWLNLGDTYTSTAQGTTNSVDDYVGNGTGKSRANYRPFTGLKPKDLVGIPWAVAKALQQPYYTGKIKNESDRVWLSAMMDAEGTICGFYHIRTDDGSPRTGIHINITNSDERILKKAFDIYPDASKHEHIKNYEGHFGHKKCWRWHIFNVEEKQNLLSEIYPYLVSKKKQAMVAWNFLEYQKKAKHYGKTPQKQEVRDLRKEMVNMISRLNHGEDIELPKWMVEPPSFYEQGWWLRQDIIWSKPNPMPESVTDRCTKSHEYVFLLTKSKDYYYDAEAIKEQGVEKLRLKEGNAGENAVDRKKRGYDNYCGTNGNRNKRSVWTITTKPFKGAHFATFPPDLIEPMIKAGTSEKGNCSKCGKPFERIIERIGGLTTKAERIAFGGQRDSHHFPSEGKTGNPDYPPSEISQIKTIDWKTNCSCNAEAIPALVLDPFMGAGTTGLVSRKLLRHYIGFELNPSYVAMANKRLANVPCRLEAFAL